MTFDCISEENMRLPPPPYGVVIFHNYIYSLGDHFGYHMVQDSLLPTFPIRESQATHLRFGDSIETAAQKLVRSVQKS